MTRPARKRKTRRDGRYWDDSRRNSPSLGCSRCGELSICGGLHVASSAFDCTSYCCGEPQTCTIVCQRSPIFVDRVREVSGFDLYQVQRTATRNFPRLPSSVPLIYAKGRRIAPFNPGAASVVLYQLIDRKEAALKFPTRQSLCNYFGLASAADLVLSGTDKDPPLERWWRMGNGRREILGQLSELGFVAATTPNFSVFSDVPRWDNFHAMKRIAICWREMMDAGIPTALHVNARALHDWRRWTEFVQQREEVDAIAYEFATGAVARMAYHVDELRNLADRVNRPLTLLVRGALTELSDLRKSYAHVSMIDSSTYMRSVNRKYGVLRDNGRVAWQNAPDRPDVDLDALFEHNHLTMLAATAPRSEKSHKV